MEKKEYDEIKAYLENKTVPPNVIYTSNFYTMCKKYVLNSKGQLVFLQTNALVLQKGKITSKIAKEHISAKDKRHLSFEKTYENVRAKYYWYSMVRDIDEFIMSCKVCDKPFKYQKFELLMIDILGPFPICKGHRYLLVFTEGLTQWAEGHPLVDNLPKTVAVKLAQVYISLYGRFGFLMTNQDEKFNLEILKYFPDTKLSIYNQVCKLTNKTASNMILNNIGDPPQEAWIVAGLEALSNYRITKHGKNRKSPYFYFNGVDFNKNKFLQIVDKSKEIEKALRKQKEMKRNKLSPAEPPIVVLDAVPNHDETIKYNANPIILLDDVMIDKFLKSITKKNKKCVWFNFKKMENFLSLKKANDQDITGLKSPTWHKSLFETEGNEMITIIKVNNGTHNMVIHIITKKSVWWYDPKGKTEDYSKEELVRNLVYEMDPLGSYRFYTIDYSRCKYMVQENETDSGIFCCFFLFKRISGGRICKFSPSKFIEVITNELCLDD